MYPTISHKNAYSEKVFLRKNFIAYSNGQRSIFEIANILKYNFYDIDHMIEKKFKITIKQLFQKHGEVFFRKIEKKTIRDLILKINKNREKVIISLGGGGFDDKKIRDLLLSNTNVIWLNTPVDVLVQRVGDGSKRPMIKGKTRDSILQLLKIRTKY